MAITKSYNELLLEKLNAELLSIKKTNSKYYIDINSVYSYLVDPQDDKLQASEYPVAYIIISDESPIDIISSKANSNNMINVEIGVIAKVSKTNAEQTKEDIKKSLKYYLRTSNTINTVRGYDASYLSKTSEKITCYSHQQDSNILLITFNFQIKTNLIN